MSGIGDGFGEVVRRDNIFTLSAIDQSVACRKEGRVGGIGFYKFDFGIHAGEGRLVQCATVANLNCVVSINSRAASFIGRKDAGRIRIGQRNSPKHIAARINGAVAIPSGNAVLVDSKIFHERAGLAGL